MSLAFSQGHPCEELPLGKGGLGILRVAELSAEFTDFRFARVGLLPGGNLANPIGLP